MMEKVLKDEQGLTLVELLAVVVILGIIATIATVGIGQIIQNSREDAEAAKIVQLVRGAQLYALQNNNEPFPTSGPDKVTVSYLRTQGFIHDMKFINEDAVVFKKPTIKDGVSVTIPVNTLQAGNKKNCNQVEVSEDTVGKLERKHLFVSGTSFP